MLSLSSLGAAVTNLCCYCMHKTNILTSPNNIFKIELWKKKNFAKSNQPIINLAIHPRIQNPTPSTTRTGALVLLMVVGMMFWGDAAVDAATVEDSMDTMSNVPQTLAVDDHKRPRIQRPKSSDAERCTAKCVTACIRGGPGSPGEAPLNAMRPLVVFKEGFHSRRYCLVECSDICNLIKDGDERP